MPAPLSSNRAPVTTFFVMNDSDAYQRRKQAFARMITVYGRKPVLETLRDPTLECHAVHLADSNRGGGIIAEIEHAAGAREIPVRRHTRAALSRISRNGRQDQGVAVDVVCPGFTGLEHYLGSLPSRGRQRLMALDGITNPQNLGMLLRSATAAGIEGILWSARGNAALGPLVIKASAGIVYRAPIIRCEALAPALSACREHGFEVCGLSADASLSLFEHRPRDRCIYVLGNESTGLSGDVCELADTSLCIPMANGVESLNVAVTASLIAYATALRPVPC